MMIVTAAHHTQHNQCRSSERFFVRYQSFGRLIFTICSFFSSLALFVLFDLATSGGRGGKQTTKTEHCNWGRSHHALRLPGPSMWSLPHQTRNARRNIEPATGVIRKGHSKH